MLSPRRMATSEELAQSRALVEELRHKEEQLKGGVAEVEARELALKGKFDQCAFTSTPEIMIFIFSPTIYLHLCDFDLDRLFAACFLNTQRPFLVL